jgi:hypothetical protein
MIAGISLGGVRWVVGTGYGVVSRSELTVLGSRRHR